MTPASSSHPTGLRGRRDAIRAPITAGRGATSTRTAHPPVTPLASTPPLRTCSHNAVPEAPTATAQPAQAASVVALGAVFLIMELVAV